MTAGCGDSHAPVGSTSATERTGGVAHIVLDAVDTDGRELHATADAVSRMALSGGGSGLTVNTMLRWTVDGRGNGLGRGPGGVVAPGAARARRGRARG